MFGALLLESSSKIIHKKKTLNSIDKNKQLKHTLTHEVFRQKRKREMERKKSSV